MKASSLLFVYNETSNPISMVMGFAHRIASPETYECHLCDITYGYLTMKPDWKNYVKSLDIPVEFRLKDIALKKYPELKNQSFPSAFYRDEEGNLKPLISSEEMNRIKDVSELKDLVERKLRT